MIHLKLITPQMNSLNNALNIEEFDSITLAISLKKNVCGEKEKNNVCGEKKRKTKKLFT